MSKAFTKEDDGGHAPVLARPRSPLRPGERNYLTAAGAQKLREELENLSTVERPRLVTSAQEDPEARHRLDVLEQRVAYLQESLRTAEILPPPADGENRVRFGANVTVRESSGRTTTYRLVGVDETDLDRNWVSWQSPIGRALLNRQVGDRVSFAFPAGKTELEIVALSA